MTIRLKPIITTAMLLVGCTSAVPEKEPIVVIDDGTDIPVTPVNNVENDDRSVEPVEPIVTNVDPEGVQILEVSLSSSTLTEDGVIMVSTRVTHPDGFDTIGGGSVLTRDGQTLGNFVGSAGTYEFALTWAGLGAVEPINFDFDVERTLLVEFFDAENRLSTMPFTVHLSCDGLPACDGECGKLECDGACRGPGGFSEQEHCGGCGNACDAREVCTLVAGTDQDPTCEAFNANFGVCESDGDCAPTATCYFDESIGDRCVTVCAGSPPGCATGECISFYGIPLCADPCTDVGTACTGETICRSWGERGETYCLPEGLVP